MVVVINVGDQSDAFPVAASQQNPLYEQQEVTALN